MDKLLRTIGGVLFAGLALFGISKTIQNIQKKAERHTFISFDYEDDSNYRFLLDALSKNPKFDFHFKDGSSARINSKSVSKVKEILTKRIKETDYTLILIGKSANTEHKDFKEIGFKNWINFEVARSIKNNNKLIAVQINNKYEYPDELKHASAYRVHSFTVDGINKAFDEV